MKATHAFCIIVVLGLVGCDRTESDWTKAQQANTVDSYDHFIAEHPKGAHIDDAERRIDDLDWSAAKLTNTREACLGYLQKHAEGRHTAEAHDGTDDLDWATAKANNSIEAYSAYLKVYPQGRHADVAHNDLEDLDWSAAKAKNAVSACSEYLQRYPSRRHADEATSLIESLEWTAAHTSNTAESYSQYLRKHPHGPHAGEAGNCVDDLDWNAATAASTIQSYADYLGRHPQGQHAEDASTVAKKADARIQLKLSEWTTNNRAKDELDELRITLLQPIENEKLDIIMKSRVQITYKEDGWLRIGVESGVKWDLTYVLMDDDQREKARAEYNGNVTGKVAVIKERNSGVENTYMGVNVGFPEVKADVVAKLKDKPLFHNP